MGEFPSGQRGQTVNLLLIASVVRIHLPPPIPNTKVFGIFVFSRVYTRILLSKSSEYKVLFSLDPNFDPY